jgi:hypothetical protein
MSHLDINTPAGQETLKQEREIKAFIERSGKVRYCETNKKLPARVDAILINDEGLLAVAETKCRDNTQRDLHVAFKNEWLVTWDKISVSIDIARALCVPLVGYLYLVPSRVVLSIRIMNERGLILPPIRLEATETQATVNGGKIVRTNAYIGMGKAKVWPLDAPAEEVA